MKVKKVLNILQEYSKTCKENLARVFVQKVFFIFNEIKDQQLDKNNDKYLYL